MPVRSNILVLSVILLTLAAPALRAGPPPEVRGTWLTTTANDAIATPQQTAATMKRLREIGLNTVYVECWKNGYTEFSSETMNRTIGVPMKVNASKAGAPAVQRDLLQEAVIEAHRNGLLCVAWFEYGLMAAYKDTHNELRTRHADWMIRDAKGSDVAHSNPFVWMNPLRPEVQDLLIGIVVEAVQKYDLDGVQLDDRIAWPGPAMGYDEYTRQAYAKEHGGKEPPADGKDPEWMRWRADKVTQFAQRFATEVRAATKNPKLVISVSPAPFPWCYDHYLCDWPTWAKWEGPARWDEFVPQVYRLDYKSFETTWLDQVKHIGDRKADLLAGIRIVGDGPDLSWEHLKQSIELTRKTGGGGHLLWFSRGVLDVYPKELKAFYDVATTGPAPHPDVPPDWRPAPIRATRDAQGRWAVPADTSPGTYRVIARVGGQWAVAGSAQVGRTATPIDAPEDATEVELLIDRQCAGDDRP